MKQALEIVWKDHPYLTLLLSTTPFAVFAMVEVLETLRGLGL